MVSLLVIVEMRVQEEEAYPKMRYSHLERGVDCGQMCIIGAPLRVEVKTGLLPKQPQSEKGIKTVAVYRPYCRHVLVQKELL